MDVDENVVVAEIGDFGVLDELQAIEAILTGDQPLLCSCWCHGICIRRCEYENDGGGMSSSETLLSQKEEDDVDEVDELSELNMLSTSMTSILFPSF